MAMADDGATLRNGSVSGDAVALSPIEFLAYVTTPVEPVTLG